MTNTAATPDQWKNDYALLREYIATHPEIVLTPNEISIPQSLRDEFYRLFDVVRASLVAARLDVLPLRARDLSEHYCRIEKEAAALLGVEKIDMPIDLHVFLHNPEQALIRAVYNCLFAVIQGKITADEFIDLADDSIAATAAELFRLGYERWAGLELIKLLEPEEVFFVDLDEDFKPYLTRLKTVSFGKQSHHPTMRIPEMVVRSRRFGGKLVALKMALTIEIDEYYVPYKPAVRPKKRTGDTSLALDSRTVLLSFLESEKKIPVYADIYECTRTAPDWLVEYCDSTLLEDPTTWRRIRRHLEILNPKCGCTLLVLGELPALDTATIPPNTHLVAADFDATRLGAALDILSA